MSEVANRGAIRPPLLYLGATGIGLLAHFRWRVELLPTSISMPIGVALVLPAGVLFASAARALRKAGTPVPGNRPTTLIVRAGPYRLSRNPIYLAFTLFALGIAAWVNSLWLVATLVVPVAIMSRIVIPREEQYLEQRFGAEYLEYKKSVGRWL